MSRAEELGLQAFGRANDTKQSRRKNQFRVSVTDHQGEDHPEKSVQKLEELLPRAKEQCIPGKGEEVCTKGQIGEKIRWKAHTRNRDK